MFPSYAVDGSASYDDYTFDDPLNLNGISDADVAAFMASSESPQLSYAAPPAVGGASYSYPERLLSPNTRSPASYARPLLPSTGPPAGQGTKRKAGAEPASAPRRKESKSTPAAAVAPAPPEKTSPRLRTSTRAATKRSPAPMTTAPAAKAHPRTPHHFTEKKYRDRLNDQFGRLLQALETSASREFADAAAGADDDCGAAGRFLSKSAVLEMARHRLRALERENEGLVREVERLAEILRARPVV